MKAVCATRRSSFMGSTHVSTLQAQSALAGLLVQYQDVSFPTGAAVMMMMDAAGSVASLWCGKQTRPALAPVLSVLHIRAHDCTAADVCVAESMVYASSA